MNPRNAWSTALVSLAAFGLGSGAAAQSEHDPIFVKSSTLIGADVKIRPGGMPATTTDRERDAAGRRDGDAPARGDVKEIGEVKDLILDVSRTDRGALPAFAILSSGDVFCLGQGKGMASLRWDAADKCFYLEQSGPTGMHEAAGAHGGQPATGEMHRSDRPAAETTAQAPTGLLLCSTLDELKIFPKGAKDSIGSVGDVVLDVRHGRVGFLTIGTGGVLGVGESARLLPWQAVRLERAPDGATVQIVANATKEQIESAPEIDEAKYNDGQLRTNAWKHYNCDDPWVKGTGTPRNERDGDRPGETGRGK
jgi:hypothetical protein